MRKFYAAFLLLAFLNSALGYALSQKSNTTSIQSSDDDDDDDDDGNDITDRKSIDSGANVSADSSNNSNLAKDDETPFSLDLAAFYAQPLHTSGSLDSAAALCCEQRSGVSLDLGYEFAKHFGLAASFGALDGLGFLDPEGGITFDTSSDGLFNFAAFAYLSLPVSDYSREVDRLTSLTLEVKPSIHIQRWTFSWELLYADNFYKSENESDDPREEGQYETTLKGVFQVSKKVGLFAYGRIAKFTFDDAPDLSWLEFGGPGINYLIDAYTLSAVPVLSVGRSTDTSARILTLQLGVAYAFPSE